jgi:hypothetical protein
MGDDSGNDNEQLNLKVVGQDGQVVQVLLVNINRNSLKSFF